MLIKIKLFFKHLFKFRSPEIIQFNHVDYVIINKSYFLVSWKSKYAYRLNIKPFYSTYYNIAGSIYTLIPPDIDVLEIEFSNLWRSKKFEIPLKKTEITVPFEFAMVPKFKEWQSANIHLPRPKTSSKKLLLDSIPFKFSKPIISIQNLTFLKP